MLPDNNAGSSVVEPKAQADLPPILIKSNPVQRPLARPWVVLSHRVNAYYGLIRNSRPLPSIYGLIRWDTALRPCMGLDREAPQFAPHIHSPVPPSVPRWTERLHPAVASSLMLAFTLFAQVRHPQFHPQRFSDGRVTRLQSSLNATARQDCLPFTVKDFYFRAFTL